MDWMAWWDSNPASRIDIVMLVVWVWFVLAEVVLIILSALDYSQF